MTPPLLFFYRCAINLWVRMHVFLQVRSWSSCFVCVRSYLRSRLGFLISALICSSSHMPCCCRLKYVLFVPVPIPILVSSSSNSYHESVSSSASSKKCQHCPKRSILQIGSPLMSSPVHTKHDPKWKKDMQKEKKKRPSSSGHIR